MRRALVLVVDGWGAGFAGCYGNSWLETPALDQWACQSVLLEQCLTECPDPLVLYPHLLAGTHPLSGGPGASPLDVLHHADIPVHLLTDDARLADLRHTTHVDSVETFPDLPPLTADSAEATHLARFFGVLLEWLEQSPREEIIWAHSRGILGPWDAPYEYRASLADEDDPDPPELIQPPFERENRQFDSDHVLGITQAYAGQVIVLDMLLGVLLDALEELPDDQQPLVVLTSTGGYPLGLHGQIGRVEGSPLRLYSDTLHVPLMIRQPGARDGLARVQGLAQLGDLLPTILNHFGLAPHHLAGRNLLSDADQGHSHVLCCLDDQRSLRTTHWSLRYHLPQSQAPLETVERDQIVTELFVKPDDRWEINNVADRCPNVAELGLATALEIEKAHQHQSPPPPLPEELRTGVD